MNFFVTSEPPRRLKNAFHNIKQYKLIDVDDLFESTGMDPNDDVCGFIIDEEIKNMIIDGTNSKKYNGIIYINSNLDRILLDKLKNLLYKIEDSSTVDITMLDDFDVPKLENMYNQVDNVTFFPILKKPKVIRCKRVQ